MISRYSELTSILMYTQHQARFEESGDEPKKCKSVTVII